MADMIAWCFHSPRRLLLVAVTVIAVVLGGAVAVQSLLPGRAPDPTRTTSGIAPPPGSEPAVTAAIDFARRWASIPPGQDAQQWRAGLAGLVTPELARGLDLTDPATLPGGAPDGPPVLRFVSVASVLVEVPLSSGHRILVTVILVDGRWLASDVEPLQGNLGDVPSGSASGSPAVPVLSGSASGSPAVPVPSGSASGSPAVPVPSGSTSPSSVSSSTVSGSSGPSGG